MYYYQQKGTIAGNWENRFFSENFFILFFLRLAKTLSGFRDLGKKQEQFFFLILLFHPPLKYFVKKVCAPSIIFTVNKN
jgi:hypothetical protein